MDHHYGGPFVARCCHHGRSGSTPVRQIPRIVFGASHQLLNIDDVLIDTVGAGPPTNWRTTSEMYSCDMYFAALRLVPFGALHVVGAGESRRRGACRGFSLSFRPVASYCRYGWAQHIIACTHP